MAGIGIVLNQNAGKHRPFRGRIGEKLAFILGDPESVRETHTVDEIDEVARAFFEKKIDILGIGGGDGSNHYTISKIIKAYKGHPLPQVAFLCGGTHNAHAASVNIRGTPEKLLEKIIRIYHQGGRFNTVLRKTLCLRHEDSETYGFTMATGFMHRFYQELVTRQKETSLKVMGTLAAWIGSFVVRGKMIEEVFQKRSATIEINQQPFSWTEFNGLSCSTMEKLGLGFTPYPRANETPLDFQLDVVRIRPGAFIPLLWRFKRGSIPKHEDHFNTICHQVKLTTEDAIEYVLDGELYKAGNQLEISTGPSFELIVI